MSRINEESISYNQARISTHSFRRDGIILYFRKKKGQQAILFYFRKYSHFTGNFLEPRHAESYKLLPCEFGSGRPSNFIISTNFSSKCLHDPRCQNLVINSNRRKNLCS